MDFEVDAGIVLGLLQQKAQDEPLLAAWIDAAVWQAVALQQDTDEEDEEDD